jgi:hypothetical protein
MDITKKVYKGAMKIVVRVADVVALAKRFEELPGLAMLEVVGHMRAAVTETRLSIRKGGRPRGESTSLMRMPHASIADSASSGGCTVEICGLARGYGWQVACSRGRTRRPNGKVTAMDSHSQLLTRREHPRPLERPEVP